MPPVEERLWTRRCDVDYPVGPYGPGDGVGWHRHGDGARRGQADANRPMFLRPLGQEYLASIDDVHAALSGGGRVADVGCGLGWSSIGIAHAYPDVRVDGFDIDAPSIEMAAANAATAGVDDRVRFQVAYVGHPAAAAYDLVLMDVQMPGIDGLEATRRIRRLPGGRAGVPVIAIMIETLARNCSGWSRSFLIAIARLSLRRKNSRSRVRVTMRLGAGTPSRP